VPVIVVGNLTVGGVGKTPLVMALTAHFKSRNLKVGIVSRGYRSKLRQFPYEVNINDSADLVGDEPLLLAQKTHVPVVIAPKRWQAVDYLIQKHACQVVISDDGLQHTAMGRALEIVVVDGANGFGNGFCLPAGPLREPISRLNSVDFIFIHGDNNTNILLDSTCVPKYRMDLQAKYLLHLTSGLRVAAGGNLPTPIAALAGIGRPERFFDSLRALGYVFNAYSFTDHHAFISSDLNFTEPTVLMTEKDAVKCTAFFTDAMYALSVEAQVCPAFWSALDAHPKLKLN
jgi:tetraacyldisaccharide 4'-kinase